MDTTTAAAQAKVTVATIRHWARLGAVRAVKTAGRWAINPASLARRIALTAGRPATPQERAISSITTARVDLDGSRYDRDNPHVEFFGRVLAWRPERDAEVRLARGVTLTQGRFARTGGSERYPAVGAADGIVLTVSGVPGGHPDFKWAEVTAA